MLCRAAIASMTRRGATLASTRTQAIARHMTTQATEEPILFESNRALRAFVLNRQKALNALDEDMLNTLRPQIEEWNQQDLCGTIVGRGNGNAFCAGGDVKGIVQLAADVKTRPTALRFFKREFELDYILAKLRKPYVVLMDGITMGGGVGLSAPAPFRVATEKTNFAMPETKIGYFPDVGASYFLSRLDGELGTYFALTGNGVRGRAVYELGFATHFISSSRVPALLARLAALEDPNVRQLNSILEELHFERLPAELPTPLTGEIRVALDSVFRHSKVENIFKDLVSLSNSSSASDDVKAWAGTTLADLELRSPTSLIVALIAIRRGKNMTLRQVLEMELGIATAFCSGASPDFTTGVTHVLIEKKKEGRAAWSPSLISDISENEVESRFFARDSPYLVDAPELTFAEMITEGREKDFLQFALPSESVIKDLVLGSKSGSGSTSITLEELITKLESSSGGKSGVRAKVEEVAKRKCEIVDNGDGQYQWLKWKH